MRPPQGNVLYFDRPQGKMPVAIEATYVKGRGG
jgi:hypothetical protein